MDHLSNFFLFFLARSFIQTVDRRTKGSSLPLLYIERLQYPTKERASVLYFLQTVRSRSLLHPVLYVDLSCNIPRRGNLIKTIARGRMNELDEGRMFSFFFSPLSPSSWSWTYSLRYTHHMHSGSLPDDHPLDESPSTVRSSVHRLLQRKKRRKKKRKKEKNENQPRREISRSKWWWLSNSIPSPHQVRCLLLPYSILFLSYRFCFLVPVIMLPLARSLARPPSFILFFLLPTPTPLESQHAPTIDSAQKRLKTKHKTKTFFFFHSQSRKH